MALLWKLVKDSDHLEKSNSFLFGTMHVRNQSAFNGMDQVYKSIRACEAYAAECDLSQPLTLSMPHFSKSVNNLLDTKRFNKVRAVIKRSCDLDIQNLAYLPPSFVINAITSKVLYANIAVSLDEHLYNFAKSEGKSLSGIETVNEQLQTLAIIPDKLHTQQLLAISRNFPKYRRHLLKMTKWYEEGDLQKIYKRSKASAHQYRRQLIYDRNYKMATRIVTLIDQKPTFIGIGAAHLPGEKGVLRYIKNAGYKVKPVI